MAQPKTLDKRLLAQLKIPQGHSEDPYRMPSDSEGVTTTCVFDVDNQATE